MKACLVFFVIAVVSCVAFGEKPLAVSQDRCFFVDTTGDACIVTVQSSFLLPYRTGATVTAMSEDDMTADTLVSVAAADGSVSWNPSSGGCWTLTNSSEGTATFLVRYSIFEAGGTGTESSPAKIVDGKELSDLILGGGASEGFTFSLHGSIGISDVELPQGWALQGISGGKFCLKASASGMCYQTESVPFVVETEDCGPNRKKYGLDDTWLIAYSGDCWSRRTETESRLSISSPSGETIVEICSGTGIRSFCPTEKGLWTVMLETGAKVYSGVVRVRDDGMVLIVR